MAAAFFSFPSCAQWVAADIIRKKRRRRRYRAAAVSRRRRKLRLAFSTLGCPEWSLEQILQNGEEMGFQGVELRGVAGQMNLSALPAFSPQTRELTMARFALRGLKVCAMATSVCFHDPEKLEEALQEGREAIALCSAIGIPYIRVFGNWVACAPSLEDEVKRVAQGLKTLCADAEGTGVTVLLEVHGHFNTVPRLLKTAELVQSDHFGILWDVAHSDDVYGRDFLAFYRPLRSLIRHVHLKDHVHGPHRAIRLCGMGEGEIPLRAIIEQLEADGYPGFYSLEWEKKWHPELDEPEAAFPAFVAWMNALK